VGVSCRSFFWSFEATAKSGPSISVLDSAIGVALLAELACFRSPSRAISKRAKELADRLLSAAFSAFFLDCRHFHITKTVDLNALFFPKGDS
jgi:hypothetical protein